MKLNSKITQLCSILNNLEVITSDFENAVQLVVTCYRSNNKVLLIGNGGSAAEAQHIAAEYMSTLTIDNKRDSLPALALSTDTSFLTANSNDYGFDKIFERQIESLGNAGDILIALSSSGNSKNIIRGIIQGRKNGLKIISITGYDGGKIKELSDVILCIPSKNTQQIQEVSLFLQHSIVEAVESELFKK